MPERYVPTLQLAPTVTYPELSLGDSVRFERDGEVTEWMVSEIDKNGHVTLDPANLTGEL